MARARNIKPGFYANEDLAECSIWARFIFPGLWMLADRGGRIEDRPKRIKGELLRYDDIEIEPLLAELAARGFIVRYRADEQQLIQVTAFMRHQNPHHREAHSVLPAPPGDMREPAVAGDSASSINSAASRKPEAEPVANGQVQDKSEESPEPASGSAQPRQGLAVLIPDSLIPDSKEKHASHAQTPSGKSNAMTAKERVWSLGPEIVGGAEAGARAFLGKLVAAHGEDVVDTALSACAIEQPGLPRPWLLKACEAKAKARGAGHRNSVDLAGDDKPAWAIKAGFANRFEAVNEGCFQHNAAEFSKGKWVEVAT